MTTTPIVIMSRKHGGRGVIFEINGSPFYAVTCCEQAAIEIIDPLTRRCRTTCPVHGVIQRGYDPALTEEEKAELNDRLFGTSGLNPASDPYGERQQRQRKSGYTTEAYHRARGA